jgi:hypothetical protein
MPLFKSSHTTSRVLVMATKTGDVERVCKANKIIHSKVRNRLKNNTVQKLLYCYINLQLLKKLEQGDTFDTDNILEDFLSQGILESADGDNEPEDEEEELE